MATLTPTPVSTRQFTYHDGNFVEEASTLEANGIQPSQVYDDACDVGFTLVSHRTGRQIIFAMDDVERTCDEIQAWVYRPIPEQQLSNQERALTLVIFND